MCPDRGPKRAWITGTSPVMTTESRGVALHCNRILGTGQPGTKSGHDRLSGAAHHLNASKRQRREPNRRFPSGTNLTASTRSLLASFPRKREPRATKTPFAAPCSRQGQALDPRLSRRRRRLRNGNHLSNSHHWHFLFVEAAKAELQAGWPGGGCRFRGHYRKRVGARRQIWTVSRAIRGRSRTASGRGRRARNCRRRCASASSDCPRSGRRRAG